MGRVASSGAKAPDKRGHLFAALKRCATQGLSSALLSAVASICSAQSQNPVATTMAADEPRADVIFLHGNVYQGLPGNAQRRSIRRAEATAVRSERIQAVRTNVEIEKLKGPQTQVIDLDGHFVMPGFN